MTNYIVFGILSSILIAILVGKEKLYLDVCGLVRIIDNDNTFVSLEHAIAFGRKLAVGNYPIFLSADHLRTPIL